MNTRQRKANFVALLLGFALTACVAAIATLGWLDPLERATLDWRFRAANSITVHPNPDDPALILLDITDRDLELIDRWPWPRTQQAPLIAIPAEFGARAVVVDLTWTEPQTVSTDAPALADLKVPLHQLARTAETRPVFPDHVLATAVRDAGNAYLAYHYTHDNIERSPAFNQIVDALAANRTAEADALATQLNIANASAPRQDDLPVLTRARLTHLLQSDPRLTISAAAARLDLPQQRVNRIFDRALEAALRREARAWLNQHVGPNQLPLHQTHEAFAAFYASLNVGELTGSSPLQTAAAIAFRETLSYRATCANPLVKLAAVQPIADPVAAITPVYFQHARAAHRNAFANFQPDSDGTVRHVTIFETHGDNVLSQLGFSAGWDALGFDPNRVEIDPNNRHLTLHPRDPNEPPRRIQLDERGRMLIPWVRGRDWTKQFLHQPARTVLALHSLRENRLQNEAEARRFLRILFASKFFPDLAETARTIEDRAAVARELELERLRDQDPELIEIYTQQRTVADEAIAKAELQLRDIVLAQKERLDAGEPLSHPLTAAALDDAAFFLQQVDLLRNANRAIDREIADLEPKLREYFDGRICLVGYAATALADMVPIPTHPRAPGVMAHANILNGLLSNQLMSWATPPVNATITVIVGVIASLVGTYWPPRRGIIAAAALLLAHLALATALFYFHLYWLAVTPAALAIVLPFLLISVYQYVFVDSERRQLATALGQYTSREIARQVAENPELCKKAEYREVTAMFTDLQGFTSISEEIGAQRTQNVLNLCLGRFTDVLLTHEAMVNKFIGDGIFAFWNPLIFPQPDHARRACEAALVLQWALARLQHEQRDTGDAALATLVLRVGVATGYAVVGPCGSEQKFDYTCIGDSVNVAARLESANKFYGTRILASGAALASAADLLAARPLGSVRVKGKQQAVPIFELLGYHTPHDAPDPDLVATPNQIAYAEKFGQAVKTFQQRNFAAAAALFETCATTRPDDPAATAYLAATRKLADAPPTDDWSGALELTEK